ncbi:MAG: hypothetical protein HYT80_09215 [Euryarchaeota archaeon]|nr:hypothetical protein [Euryarchaeota archaeon]
MVGAFLNESRIVSTPRDGWFFARSLLLGLDRVAYGDKDQVHIGNVMVALHESSFAATITTRANGYTTPAAAQGLDAKNLLVLAAYRLPPDATSLALAFGWDEDAGGNDAWVPFESARGQLAKRGQSRQLVPLASAPEASLSFWDTNGSWLSMRVPNGLLDTKITDSATAGGASSPISAKRNISVTPLTSGPSGGWQELHYLVVDNSTGQWCHSVPLNGSTKKGCEQHAGRAYTGLNFPYLMAATDSGTALDQAWVSRESVAEGGPVGVTFWALSTSLKVSQTVHLPVSDYFFVNRS